MASDWKRRFGGFVRKVSGNVTGRTNLASWAFAGTIAYFLWVKPAQDLKKEQEAKAILASLDRYHVERRKPVPNPADTGLIYGNKNTE